MSDSQKKYTFPTPKEHLTKIKQALLRPESRQHFVSKHGQEYYDDLVAKVEADLAEFDYHET